MKNRIVELLVIILMAFATIYCMGKIAEIEENRLKELQQIERYLRLERQSNWVKAQIKLNQQKWDAETVDTLHLYEWE